MFVQFAEAAGFDLARRQVDRVGDMASAEIITGTGIYHYRVFFINQASSFTAGDLFNLGETALEGHDDHGSQQTDPGQTKYGVAANKLHNFLQHGV
ncbi:hypothetical protein D3C76_1688710 [compost metagenome]